MFFQHDERIDHLRNQYLLQGEQQILKNRPRKAASYFLEAANNGNPYAASALASMHFHGQGVPKDREWATYWAEQVVKYLEAMASNSEGKYKYYLAALYYCGLVLNENFKKGTFSFQGSKL